MMTLKEQQREFICLYAVSKSFSHDIAGKPTNAIAHVKQAETIGVMQGSCHSETHLQPPPCF